MPRFFCQSNRLSFETGYIAPTPNPANPGSDISQLAPTSDCFKINMSPFYNNMI